MTTISSTLNRLGFMLLLAMAPVLGSGCGDDPPVTDEVTSIAIQPSKASISVGATQNFVVEATLKDNSKKDVTAQSVFESSDTAIATVTSNAAKGVAQGKVTITAKYQGLQATAELSVGVKEVESLQVTPPTLTIAKGTTGEFKATINYSDGTTEDATETATWTSSDESVSLVNAGAVEGLKEGTTTITADVDGVTGTATLTVGAGIQEIRVTPANDSVAKGTTVNFKAEAILEDDSIQDVTDQVVWASSDTGVASIVATTGVASTIAAGQTTISATLGDLSGSTTLTVTDSNIVRIEITPPIATANKGGSPVQFMADAVYTDDTSEDITTQCAWTSSDPLIATVGAATGEATPVEVGNVTITCDYQGMTGTAALVVNNAVVISIEVTPVNNSIPMGTTLQYRADANYSDGSKMNITSAASWVSSLTTVATMDPTTLGLATGVAAGETEISATFNNVTGSTTLTVTDATLTGITIQVVGSSSPTQSIALGTNLTFTATGTYTNSTTADLTGIVVWNTNPTGIASFTANVLQGDAVGTTAITATTGGFTSNTITVNVTDAAPTGITITNNPGQPVPVGGSFGFTAEITFSDGSTQDGTVLGTWNSSATGVATISNAAGFEGFAVAMSGGTTDITVAYAGFTSDPVTMTVPSQSNVTLSYISIEPTEGTVQVGQSLQYTAIGHYSDGSTYDITLSVTWSARECNSDTLVGFFTVTDGLVTGVASTLNECSGYSMIDGYARVKARLGTVQSYANVIVRDSTITSISVQCAPDALSAALTCLPPDRGYLVYCTANAAFADGTSGDITLTADWTTSDSAVAVSTGVPGVIVMVGIGSANIIATQDGISSWAVGEPVPSGITVNAGPMVPYNPCEGSGFDCHIIIEQPGPNQINLGQTFQYTTREAFRSSDQSICPDSAGNFPDNGGLWGFNATTIVDWHSSNTNVATIDDAGLAHGGPQAGSTNISATHLNHTAWTMYGTSPQLVVIDSCIVSAEIVQGDEITVPSLTGRPLSVNVTDSNNETYQLDPANWPSTNWSAPCTGWSVNETSWFMLANTGVCTLTFNLPNQCPTGGGTTVTDSIVVTTDGTLVPSALELTPADTSISLGREADYTLMATYPSGTYDVTHFASSWSQTTPIPGISPAAGTNIWSTAGMPVRQFDHSGTTGGTTSVLVAYKQLSTSATLTVSTQEILNVEIISPATNTSYPVGIRVPFVARVNYFDGTHVDNPAGIIFTSSNPAALSFPPSALYGNTLAVTTTPHVAVTATYNSVPSAAITVQVNDATIDNMRFSPAVTPIDSGSACAGDMQQDPPKCVKDVAQSVTTSITIEGHYTDGNWYNISTGVFSDTSNQAAVRVTTTTTGTSVQTFDILGGPVQLSFIKDGLTRWMGVNVAGTQCLTSVTVSSEADCVNNGLNTNPITLMMGQDTTHYAFANDNMGNTCINITGSGTWTTTPAGVLSNDGGGDFSAASEGTATVDFSYSSNGYTVCAGGDLSQTTISDSNDVTVNAAGINAVAIRPVIWDTSTWGQTTVDLGSYPLPYCDTVQQTCEWRIPINESRQMQGWAEMTDGPDVNITTDANTVWTANNNPSLVTVVNGLVTAGSTPGVTTITLTNGAHSFTLIINVVSCGAPVLAVDEPASSSLPVGLTRQFQGIARFNQGACSSWEEAEYLWLVTDHPNTAWTATDNTGTGVASINSGTGLATANAAGISDISFTYKSWPTAAPVEDLVVVNAVLTALNLSYTTPTTNIGVGPSGSVTVEVSASYEDAGGNPIGQDLDPPLVQWFPTGSPDISLVGPIPGTNNRQYTLTGLQVTSPNPVTFYAYTPAPLIQSNSLDVTVVNVCYTDVTITDPAGGLTIPNGAPFTLNTRCTRSDGTTTTNCGASLSFLQLNQSNAAVGDPDNAVFNTDGVGVLNGSADGGTVDVRASVTGCDGTIFSSTRTLTEGSATLSEVTLPSTYTIPNGHTVYIPATATFVGGTGAGSYVVTLNSAYLSENLAVATVNANNQIVAQQIDGGVTLVTAVFMGMTSNICTVTTTGRVLTAIEIWVEEAYRHIGGGAALITDTRYPADGWNMQLGATGTFSNTDDDNITGNVNWSLVDTAANPLVPGTTITTGGMLTTGIPAGAAITGTQLVMAEMDGISATYSVEIVEGTIQSVVLVYLNNSPIETSVPQGVTTNFHARITFDDTNSYMGTNNFVWASSNETAGTIVSTSGEFHAVTAGQSTNVSATRGTDSSGPVAILISTAEPEYIVCLPAVVNLVTGATGQLQAWIHLTDGTDIPVTADASWVSTPNTWVANFQGTTVGLITAFNPGTTYGVPTYQYTDHLGANQSVTATGTDRCEVIVTAN